jgi:Zn-dependent protease with chaperone function
MLLAAIAAIEPLHSPCAAQTSTQRARGAQSGFNIFTVNQDIEIGRQSAIEAEKQLTLLNSVQVDRYLNRIVQRLAAVAPGARYPYAIKAVSGREINAFSLPGGPMYVNAGLIATVRSEAELTGVLAHEMAHVALRHGTSNASSRYLAQTGLGLLGGLFGKRGSNASNVVNAVGGVGLNVAFLKFNRDEEYQADEVGAQIMASAGFDPNAMADFFETLRREQSRNPGQLERFLSDHPPAADREARIRELASTLPRGQVQPVGNFARIQASVARGTQVAAGQSPWPTSQPYPTTPTEPISPIAIRVEPPSQRFVSFRQGNGFYSISYPENWRAWSTGTAFATTIAPEGGVVDLPNGQQQIVYGVVLNHYAPFEGPRSRYDNSMQRNYVPFERSSPTRGALEDATDDLVRQVLRTNTYLRPPDTPAQQEQIYGARGYSVILTGRSPVTGEEEQVTVVARGLPDDHMIYALFIAPAREFPALQGTFLRMLRTLVVNESAVHGSRVMSDQRR